MPEQNWNFLYPLSRVGKIPYWREKCNRPLGRTPRPPMAATAEQSAIKVKGNVRNAIEQSNDSH